jgi:hypothetical protein
MTPGEIILEGTLADMVMGGGGFSELRFREPAQKPVTIMTHSDSKPALTCKTCSFFVILNDPEFTDTECVVCHTGMLGGVTSCPKCGWTYQAHED